MCYLKCKSVVGVLVHVNEVQESDILECAGAFIGDTGGEPTGKNPTVQKENRDQNYIFQTYEAIPGNRLSKDMFCLVYS